MKTFLTIILVLFFLNAKAQYVDYVKITDVRTAIVYDMIFSKVKDADAELLKYCKVKNVTALDETGNVKYKFSLNKDGRIINYSTFEYNDGEEINYVITWEENKMKAVQYKENNMSINYSFSYDNSLLNYIRADFGMGVSEDYIFDYNNNGRIKHIAFRDNSKDTVYMTILFEYSGSKLVKTFDSKFDNAIDTIFYENDAVTLEQKSYLSREFRLNGNRIEKEIHTFPQKQLRAKVNTYKTQIPDIVTTYNYFYKENGLIEYIDSKTGNTSYKTILSYEYFQD